MFFMLAVALVIPSILLLVNFSVAKKELNEREKPSPFECGFDPISSARVPFSLQFFLIAVIFLIFDVELTLILPIIQSVNVMNLSLLPISTIFFFVLIAGLYLEWAQGALEWYY